MAVALVPAAVKSRRRPRLRRIALDPGEAADAAQLRYVSDARPGIVRVRHGRSFRYIGIDGEAVDDLPTLRRIRSLHSFCGMTYSASRNVFCLRVIHFFRTGGSSMPSMTTSS